MTRKVVAGASAFALIAANLVVLPTASAAFSDVSMDNWAYDYIMDLVDMGIVEGNPDGTFRPDNSVNRAEMAKIVSNLAKKSGVIASDDTMGAPAFRDVPAGEWFTSYVSVAAKNNLFEGYRDTQGNLTGFFGPGNAVNRAEASKVLLLAAGVPEMLTPGAPFVDVKSNDWFYPYVTSAYNWSIIDGYKTAAGAQTGSFGPGDAMTRGQISKVAVLSQDPIDRYTGIPLNEMENSNMNGGNMNTNTGTGSNMNQNGTTPVSNVSFEAKLSASSPASTTLALGTAFNTIGVFDLTAGKDEDVKVTELTVLNRGFIKDSLVAGVLVVDELGARHGSFVSFSESKAVINFASNPIVVKAGTTAKVMIQMNFDRSATNESGTVGVELPIDGIKAMGATTNGMVKVTGQTLASAIHSLVSGANVGQVQLALGTNYGNQSLDLGVMRQPISSFKVTAGSEEDISVHELTLYNNGTASDGDIKNLVLTDQDGKELARLDTTTARYATFNLSANPYIIRKGVSRNLDVRADIMNGSTRTVRFVINDDFDVKVKGGTTQAFLLPSTNTGGGVLTTTFPVGDANNLVTINEGNLTLAKATSSPSGEIANGVTDTVVAEFEAKAFGEDIELQAGTINLNWTDNGAANGVLNGTVRLTNSSGTTVHTQALSEFTDGADLVIGRFSNSAFKIAAGTTEKLRLSVDVAEGATTGDTIVATLKDLRIKKLASNRIASVASIATGNTLNVTTAGISVASNGSVGGEPIVAGASAQRIGSFNITANNTGDVNVTSIGLIVEEADSNSTAAVNGVSNIRLMVGGQSLGNPIAQPAGTNSFSVAGQLVIPKSQSRTIDVYADVNASSTMDDIRVEIPANGITGTSSNTSVQGPGGLVELQTFELAGSGTVNLAGTTTVANPKVLVAGETNVNVLSFRAQADNNEAMRLEKVLVTLNTSPNSVAGVTLMRDGVIVSGPKALNANTVEFAGLNQMVERNSSVNYTVAVNLTTSTAFNSTDALSAELTSFEAFGVSSGQQVLGTPAVTGPTMLLQNVVPVLTTKTSTSALPIGANSEVARFTVTARGNEALNMKDLIMQVSGSFDGTITGYELYRVTDGSQSVVAGTTITDNGGTSGDDLEIEFPGANGYEIASGTVAEFVLLANTSGAKTGAIDSTLSYSLSINGTAGVDSGANGVVYTYDTATQNYAGIGDQNALNEYPITIANRSIN